MSADPPPLLTPLHAWHKAHGGRMVDFAGWSMPVQYTSIIEEHQAVRQRAGLFDIGHMGRLLFAGQDALPWLEFLTTNHVARLDIGQIQYSLMVQDDGGVLDDVLVYRIETNRYHLVCNASNRTKVLAQFGTHAHRFPDAQMVDQTRETGMIAVQGPRALDLLQPLIDAPLEATKYYHWTHGDLDGDRVLVSRTGYTGEDGFELVVLAERAEDIWNDLLDAGRGVDVRPCGLGARDTLRFEAAMPLYGHEMDETVDPYSAGLGWAVKLNKGEFFGRDALRASKANARRRRVGLALEGKRIARQGCTVKHQGQPVGTVTSGTFAPTLGRSLAMALIDPSCAEEGTAVMVDVRGQDESARVVPLPFYRRS
jgi:aminomethyltransferase